MQARQLSLRSRALQRRSDVRKHSSSARAAAAAQAARLAAEEKAPRWRSRCGRGGEDGDGEGEGVRLRSRCIRLQLARHHRCGRPEASRCG